VNLHSLLVHIEHNADESPKAKRSSCIALPFQTIAKLNDAFSPSWHEFKNAVEFSTKFTKSHFHFLITVEWLCSKHHEIGSSSCVRNAPVWGCTVLLKAHTSCQIIFFGPLKQQSMQLRHVWTQIYDLQFIRFIRKLSHYAAQCRHSYLKDLKLTL